ncbi:unnamed protein product [Penicillium viridicatum]
MATTLALGQLLKGGRGVFTVTKQLHDCVWLATNQFHQTFVAKSVHHFRLQNERDSLLRFQSRTPYIRPLIDEVEDPSASPTLILKYLDDNLLDASNNKRLTRLEVIYVAKKVLEALSVLHYEGFVHTDIKPSNVLVNHGQDAVQFRDVQLADFGSTVHMDSTYAQHGDPIGTPILRGPEAHLQMKWDTATDIWSFGTMVGLKSTTGWFERDNNGHLRCSLSVSSMGMDSMFSSPMSL